MKNRSHSGTMSKSLRYTAFILFILYLSCLVFLTLFSYRYGGGGAYRRVNLVPFKTILLYATANINKNIIVANLAGNVLAFVPMGFLLPLLSKRLASLIKILFLSAAASAIIETAQYIVGGRAADIDDILLNTLGGIIGYVIYYPVGKLLNRRFRQKE